MQQQPRLVIISWVFYSLCSSFDRQHKKVVTITVLIKREGLRRGTATKYRKAIVLSGYNPSAPAPPCYRAGTADNETT